MVQEILSAGIDIGTTTSQVIFSRLSLENNSYTAVPNVRIAKKEVIYKSAIHFTPLDADGNIDEEELSRLLMEEYKCAGVRREDITTGAVIITGESSRKINAPLALRNLSSAAGDFVVAAAGPDLESVLAGYGAGAAEYSEKRPVAVANFDIGGGTTNVAVFHAGELQDAFALDIGGRLVRLSSDHRILYLSPRIQPLITAMNLSLHEGDKADMVELKCLAECFALICRKLCLNSPLSEQEEGLFLGHGNRRGKLPVVMFSGGVAEYIYRGNFDNLQWEDILIYGDIGPLVGAAFARCFAKEPSIQLLAPRERIRATVIGAGSYSVHLSGSTVWMEDEWVPLKNAPVLCLVLTENMVGLREEYELKRAMYPAEQQIAIALSGRISPEYESLKKLADCLVAMTSEEKNILLIILEQDLAKALGLMMKRCGKNRRIICLDKIRAHAGDYIDVGKTIAGTVPVVVKTLIFKS